MDTDFKNHWIPVASSLMVTKEKPYGTRVLEEPLVFYRDSSSKIICLQDVCPHRSAPLSMGKMNNGILQCFYHGWSFGEDGKCVSTPKGTKEFVEKVKVTSYPCCEKSGWVWVWMHEKNQADESKIPEDKEWNNPNWRFVEVVSDTLNDFSFSLENLLDVVHVHWLHNGRVPVMTRENYEKYKCEKINETENESRFRFFKGGKQMIDTIFQAPCKVVNCLPQGSSDKLTQVFVFVPISKVRTRVIARFYRGFFLAGDYVPGFKDMFAKGIYDVLLEDASIISGQYRRCRYGALPTNKPQAEDENIVTFQRWIKEAKKKNIWFKGWSKDIEDVNLDSCNSCMDSEETPLKEFPPLNMKPMIDLNRKILITQISYAITLIAVILVFLKFFYSKFFLQK
jgi:nitrite reductase/ring-hydroxylating ferredoxin subunit